MNLLFIITDQQNRFALGCMDNPNIITPNLDKFASKGTLFKRCYSNDPVCSPFRGTLLTGQYSTTCGVTQNGGIVKGNGALPKETPTFATILNDANYTTSWVGKWHLGGTGNCPIPREEQGGFDRFIGYQCYNGFKDNVCFYDKEGNEHKFNKHRTDVTANLAIDELRILSKGDKPFMLMTCFQAPHYPEEPSEKYDEMYKGRKIIRRPNCQEISPYTPTWSPYSARPFEGDPNYQRYGNDLDEYIRLYNAMCTQIDENIGRLLQELEDLGIADDTIVVFTSDHGDMQGSHGLLNKYQPYEESAGIPLIFYHPQIEGNKISQALVSGIDMMPTCLDFLNVETPNTVQGISFASIIKNEKESVQNKVFVEHQVKGNWCMVVKEQWKFAAHREEQGLNPYLLINLEEDPYELDNLIDKDCYKDKQQELFAELLHWYETVGDK